MSTEQDSAVDMTQGFTERQLNGKQVFLHQKGEGGPIIFWATFFHRENELEHLLESLDEEIPDENYVVAAFLAEDWNRDFSPWEAEPAFGDEAFGGRGPETLRWLKEDCVPAITEEFGVDRKRFLIGYSLAGLFSLWAGYESDLFAGIACCSGSLWFKDWDAYVSSHAIAGKCSVYLSLGSKEEKTRNPQMAKVGDRTRRQEQILKMDPNVEAVVLEWNKGGHFADSGKRLAKGVRWLMNHCSGPEADLVFRKSELQDIDQMVRIADEGKALLKSKGINQWQRGTYPDRKIFLSDVEKGIGYVLACGKEVLAICAVTFTDEEDYRNLLSGKWLTPDGTKYATIHRGAVARRHQGQNLSGKLFAAVAKMAWENQADSIRVDTHPENLTMQRALERAGFIKCGELVLLSGDEVGDLRYGYELKKEGVV